MSLQPSDGADRADADERRWQTNFNAIAIALHVVFISLMYPLMVGYVVPGLVGGIEDMKGARCESWCRQRWANNACTEPDHIILEAGEDDIDVNADVIPNAYESIVIILGSSGE